MTGQDKFNRFIERHPHPHVNCFRRPDLSRRRFFGIAGANAEACTVQTSQSVTPKNTAQNVIFVLLTGAPSHTDTFDLKVLNGATPNAMQPELINGVSWPVGLLPKMGQQLGQIFPTFLALNSPGGIGNGYLSANYAPFRVIPATTGVPNTTNTLGQNTFNQMYARLHQLDDPLRVNSPLGQPAEDYDAFYSSAHSLMYNGPVATAFSFSSADSARYGSTSFGNACLVAKQVLAANQGTRFIQISVGNWDMHQDIYGAQNPKGNNLFTLCPSLDNGISAMVSDLDQAGLLSQTLIVLAGEFGRTVGPVTPAGGRDHLNQQSIVFMGGGVKGGKILGATDATGGTTTDFGWSRQRVVRPEDVEATIYSALGINWTTIRCDDPRLRGFEYVPFSEQNIYGPIDELWS
jgi:hypothetical protein